MNPQKFHALKNLDFLLKDPRQQSKKTPQRAVQYVPQKEHVE